MPDEPLDQITQTPKRPSSSTPFTQTGETNTKREWDKDNMHTRGEAESPGG